jgi:DNA-binding transcriptional LysR family regulator
LSPGVHYLAERALSAFAREHPAARVRALADNSGAVAREVAAGRLELGLGFATEPTRGVRAEELAAEPAVVALAAGHPLATRGNVRLADLQRERFALVDPRDGAGYNDAVRGLCRDAGFDPLTAEAPSGPMAWESAVRDGCVGLTTRISLASTLRGLRVVPLSEPAAFRIDLLTPAAGEPGPLAQDFAGLARRVMHSRSQGDGTLLT